MSRTKAERVAIERDGPTCRRCGRDLTDFPSSLHHRRPKGMGGGDPAYFDRPDNLVVVCGTGTTPHCHRHIHANPSESYARGWLIRRGIDEPYQIPLTDLSFSVLFLSQEGDVIPLAAPFEPVF